MRKLKNIGLVVLGISALTGISRPVLAAPDAPKTHERGKHKGAGKRIAAELGLTDSQKSQIKAIRQAARTERDAIRNDTKLTREQKRAQMKELHAATRAKVEAVLTPEQRQKLAALRAQHKANRGERKGHREGRNKQ